MFSQKLVTKFTSKSSMMTRNLTKLAFVSSSAQLQQTQLNTMTNKFQMNLMQTPQRYFSADFEDGEEQPEQEEVEEETQLEAIPEYENIIARREEGGVGFIQLNRPKALNALNYPLFKELMDALRLFERDPSIGCIVLTGSEKSFAAGADIKEMQLREFPDTYMTDMLVWWNEIPKIKTPLVGAVNGFALGGGCELAQMCDILYAGHKAKFGQPEIKLGVIPGMGGSQRLTRAIGKSRAMELCLSSEFMQAEEACQRGLVSKVFPADLLVGEALQLGRKIASFSKPTAAAVKDAVNATYEMNLEQGLRYERVLFQSTFALKDQKEGMTAFVEGRKAHWSDK